MKVKRSYNDVVKEDVFELEVTEEDTEHRKNGRF